ncbi:MAG: TonB family protein [Acidobacteriota bacterium]|nr:TonB family protein [Acidobacteriota bacterium]
MLYRVGARKSFSLFLLSLIVCASALAQERISVQPAATTPLSITDSTRERDGLTGPVRRVHTELAKFVVKSGQRVEGERILLETTAYDLKGRRVENAFYPVDEGSVIGKEEYTYDDKGNVAEKILRDDSGAVLGKEVYTYEFDAVGNWTEMTTLIAVVEDGKVSFEPTEVTHRAITYFFDHSTAPNAQSASTSQPTTPALDPTGETEASPTSAEDQTRAPQERAARGASVSSRVMPNLAYANEGAPWLEPVIPAPRDDNAQKTTDPKVPVRIATEAPALNAAPGRADGKLLLGTPLSLPKPIYPDAARQSRLTGAVAVEVVVDGKGNVIAARAVSGHAQLRSAAVEAARQAVFSPTLVAGQPTNVVGIINYSFTYVK